MTKIALFQPDIAGNVGTIIRTCVCFDIELHIIEPCGFPFDMQRIKKSALDYIDKVTIVRHDSFDDFIKNEVEPSNARLILASTKGSVNYKDFTYQQDDILLFGRESAGVTQEVFDKSDHRVFIEMKNNMRCLNVAISCGIILSKALENF